MSMSKNKGNSKTRCLFYRVYFKVLSKIKKIGFLDVHKFLKISGIGKNRFLDVYKRVGLTSHAFDALDL